jgi:pimeloyl-ACP methyl ester carboxylesterase
MPQTATETSARTPLAPVSSGYADVNGIKLYHEIYGQGEPLVLLHGGLMTIGEMSTPLESFAKTHKVIAVELQGHGRTADTDRSLSLDPSP